MNNYNEWLNVEGSIMYYYIFDIKDRTGAAVGVDVNLRINGSDISGFKTGISNYKIHGNLSTQYIIGDGAINIIPVTDTRALTTLNDLPFRQDAIKWVFNEY